MKALNSSSSLRNKVASTNGSWANQGRLDFFSGAGPGLLLLLVLVCSTSRAFAQFIDCSCLARQPALSTNGCQGVVPDLCLYTACYTNSAPVTCSQTPAAGTVVGPGPTVITVSIMDAFGTIQTCSLVFNVNAPAPGSFTLLCGTNQTVECGTTWIFTPPTPTNFCCTSATNNGITFVSITTVTSGSCPQTITRTWVAKDACGTTASCSQTVTVVDTTPPVLNCSCITNTAALPPIPLTVTNCSGTIPDLCPYALLCAYDACGPLSCVQSPTAGTVVGPGTTPLTVTVVDCASNTASCTLIFTVVPPAGGCGTCPCTTNNLIVDGGFEGGVPPTGCQQFLVGPAIPGWSVINDEIARCQLTPPYNVTPSQGALFLDLTGYSDAPPHGGVTQTVPTTIGQCYRLTFDLGVNLDYPNLAGPITLRASAGATSVYFTHNPSGSGTVWGSYGFVFTAVSANTPISLEGISGTDFIGLDNVSLVCVCNCTNTCLPACPPTTMTVSGCPALMPDLSTNSFASSNCYVAAPLTVTQSLPPGTPLPLGPTVVTVTVCDALGRCQTCTVTITGVTTPGCRPCPCPTNNLIVDGGFEGGVPPSGCQQFLVGPAIPGWSVINDEIARCQLTPPYNVTPSQGALFLDLTGYSDAPPHGGVTQTVPTTVGQCYRLTFDLGVNLTYPNLAGPITVRASAGAVSQYFTHNPSGSGTVWSSYGFVFTAVSANTPISLEGISGTDFIGLDNVSLVCTCDCSNTCTAPCPPAMTVSGCPPLMPDFTTNSFAGSNCYVAAPLTIIQSLPPGTPLPLGPTAVTITICDALARCQVCTVTITGANSPGCNPCTCTTNNLIMDGGFEGGVPPTGCQQFLVGPAIPGWSVINDEIARCQLSGPYNVPPSQGAFFLDLTGYSDAPPHGGVTQTVPTTIGQCYRLTFDLGVNLDYPQLAGPIKVRASAGATSQYFTHNPPGPGTVWSSYGFVFTAVSANTPISIEGIVGTSFIGLDNVSLVCTCDCTNTCSPTCPPTSMSVTGCPPLMPDFSTNSFAGSNCYVAAPLTVTQSLPPGTPLPVGPTVVTVTVCDALGRCRHCDVTINGVLGSSCCTVSPVLNLFSGRNGAGPLPTGALDPQFSTGAPLFPAPSPYVPALLPSAWTVPMPNTANSQWIGPDPFFPYEPAGVFVYTNRFFLCSTNQAALTGRWTGDDTGEIYINGTPTGNILPLSYAFTNWHPVSITSGFVPGWNTLTFVITNYGSVTGLRTEITGAACCPGCLAIACPANIVRQGCLPMTITYATPRVTSTCGGAPTVICTPPSGSLFPVGVTTVTCTVTDGLGNGAICTFTVSVLPPMTPCWPLKIALAGGNLVLSWPTDATGASLQRTSHLVGDSTVWSSVTNTPILLDDSYVVTLPADAAQEFFRLIWVP